MKNKVIYCCLISLILLGCKSAPSNQDIINLIEENHASSTFAQVSDISNIEKTNGFEESENIYIADVEYDLTTTLSSQEFDAILHHQFKKESEGLKGMQHIELMMKIGNENKSIYTEFGKFKKGDVKHFKQKITFLNTEKGWRIK